MLAPYSPQRRLRRLVLSSPLLATLLLSACSTEPSAPSAAQQEAPVIYGVDDRIDVYESRSQQWTDIALRSTGAVVTRNAVTVNGGTVDYNRRVLRDSVHGTLELCADEKFGNQPSFAHCSGTLIAPDLFLSAGHCFEDQSDCTNSRIVFNYHMTSATQMAPLTADDVYDCAELVVSRYDGDMPRSGSHHDYAIIRLNRPVVGRYQPARLQVASAPVIQGEPLVMIGYPSGIPAKIDDGGIATVNREQQLDFFEASLDAFGGNSGSGVFDEDGVLVGILVRGQQDYREDRSAGCVRVNTVADGVVGRSAEGVNYALPAVRDLCSRHPELASALCAQLEASQCGNGFCEQPSETYESCPADCTDASSDLGDIDEIFGCSAAAPSSPTRAALLPGLLLVIGLLVRRRR